MAPHQIDQGITVPFRHDDIGDQRVEAAGREQMPRLIDAPRGDESQQIFLLVLAEKSLNTDAQRLGHRHCHAKNILPFF